MAIETLLLEIVIIRNPMKENIVQDLIYEMKWIGDPRVQQRGCSLNGWLETGRQVAWHIDNICRCFPSSYHRQVRYGWMNGCELAAASFGKPAKGQIWSIWTRWGEWGFCFKDLFWNWVSWLYPRGLPGIPWCIAFRVGLVSVQDSVSTLYSPPSAGDWWHLRSSLCPIKNTLWCRYFCVPSNFHSTVLSSALNRNWISFMHTSL
jgi:hypothetical protein